MNKNSVLNKVIVVGDCLYKENEHPFIMKLNLETSVAETIKILNVEDHITCVNFGPYDNGYLLMGMESGQLLVFDIKNLDRI